MVNVVKNQPRGQYNPRTSAVFVLADMHYKDRLPKEIFQEPKRFTSLPLFNADAFVVPFSNFKLSLLVLVYPRFLYPIQWTQRTIKIITP